MVQIVDIQPRPSLGASLGEGIKKAVDTGVNYKLQSMLETKRNAQRIEEQGNKGLALLKMLKKGASEEEQSLAYTLGPEMTYQILMSGGENALRDLYTASQGDVGDQATQKPTDFGQQQPQTEQMSERMQPTQMGYKESQQTPTQDQQEQPPNIQGIPEAQSRMQMEQVYPQGQQQALQQPDKLDLSKPELLNDNQWKAYLRRLPTLKAMKEANAFRDRRIGQYSKERELALKERREAREEAKESRERLRFEDEMARPPEEIKDYLKKINTQRELIRGKDQSLTLAEEAVASGKTSGLKQFIADKLGLDIALTPDSVLLNTAAKEFTIGNISRISGQKNQWIEKQIRQTFPMVGRSEEANKVALEALKMENDVNKKEVEVFDRLAAEDIAERGRIGRDIQKRVDDELKDYARNRLDNAAIRIQEIKEGKKTLKDLAIKREIPKGTPLTTRRKEALLKKFNGNVENAAKYASSLGLKVYGGRTGADKNSEMIAAFQDFKDTYGKEETSLGAEVDQKPIDQMDQTDQIGRTDQQELSEDQGPIETQEDQERSAGENALRYAGMAGKTIASRLAGLPGDAQNMILNFTSYLAGQDPELVKEWIASQTADDPEFGGFGVAPESQEIKEKVEEVAPSLMAETGGEEIGEGFVETATDLLNPMTGSTGVVRGLLAAGLGTAAEELFKGTGLDDKSEIAKFIGTSIPLIVSGKLKPSDPKVAKTLLSAGEKLGIDQGKLAGLKKYISGKETTRDLIDTGKKLGLSEKTLATATQPKDGKILAKKLASGTRTAVEGVVDAKEEIGELYQHIKDAGRSKKISMEARRTMLQEFNRMRREITAVVGGKKWLGEEGKKALSKINALKSSVRKKAPTVEELVNSYQQLNQDINWNKVFSGKKNPLVGVKNVFVEGINSADPKLGKNFQFTNKIYSNVLDLREKITPGELKSLIDSGEAQKIMVALTMMKPSLLGAMFPSKLAKWISAKRLTDPNWQNIFSASSESLVKKSPKMLLNNYKNLKKKVEDEAPEDILEGVEWPD